MNKAQIEQHIINPLLDEHRAELQENNLVDMIGRIIHAAKVKKCSFFSEITRDILEGNTILLIDG